MSLIDARHIRDLQSRFGFLVNVKTRFQRHVRTLLKQPFESEFEILKYLAPQGRDALDIGANRGQSIDAIRLYHSDVQINAFEPNARLFVRLVSQHEKDRNLALHNIGLGQGADNLELFIPYYRNFLYDGLSSFSSERASKWLNAETVWRFDPKLLKVEQHNCEIKRLDHFSYHPFFIKIHVQGFELEVLEGAQETIASHSPVILIANHAEADLWLRDRGWLQYALIDGQWRAVAQNTMTIYNSVYFNPASAEHSQIIQRLKA